MPAIGSLADQPLSAGGATKQTVGFQDVAWS